MSQDIKPSLFGSLPGVLREKRHGTREEPVEEQAVSAASPLLLLAVGLAGLDGEVVAVVRGNVESLPDSFLAMARQAYPQAVFYFEHEIEDLYPYRGSEQLIAAVHRAKKALGGRVIGMLPALEGA